MKEFKCPGCGLLCTIEQVSPQLASLRHQLPPCDLYKREKNNGQKFLEIAFGLRPGSAALVGRS